MGDVNLLAVIIGTVVWFAFGGLYYHFLFGERWRTETGLTREQMAASNPRIVLLLAFLFEMLIVVMLGHMYARLMPQPYVMMMMAFGFGATIITPAIGINYLFQRKSGKLFAIDAGHFIIGLLLVGGVFVLMR